MNGERRMRLTKRYMDPPCRPMPDCLITTNMERVFRDMDKNDVADRFMGLDWNTEEDDFMDGFCRQIANQHQTPTTKQSQVPGLGRS
jgi:arsenite oxidase large subunit